MGALYSSRITTKSSLLVRAACAMEGRALDVLAKVSAEVNASVENIGARRLHTLLEKVLDDISFTASDRSGEKIVIDKKYIEKNLGELTKDTDLSKFIL